jgi:hypothetical protein
MESRTYTIPEISREKIEKLVAWHQKKATAYGIPMTVEYGDPYCREYKVYDLDPVTHTKTDTGLTELHEVFDLTIASEVIRKDGYQVVAKLEHTEDGNIVSTFGDSINESWITMKPFCSHCNANHGLLTTFIVRHESGSEKQVGRTCLKDYCGIDPQAIGYLNALEEILIGECADCCDFREMGIPKAYNTLEVLELAVRAIREQGYRRSDEPGSNKQLITEWMTQREMPSDADKLKAKTIADSVKAMSQEEAFASGMSNVKTLLECGYCKTGHFGYIAYAPLGFDRYQERKREKEEREAAKQALRDSSEYIGEIGKRITIKITDLQLVTSWETDWGITHLYKFRDENGNVIVWFASSTFGYWGDDGEWHPYDNSLKAIKATIKAHEERDGVKQTIVSRCKAA